MYFPINNIDYKEVNGEIFYEVTDKVIPNIRPKYYYVSTSGKIYNAESNRILANSDVKDRYLTLHFRLNDGGTANEYIHRVIIGTLNYVNDMNTRLVNHINTNKYDNRLDNLEWSSYADNCLHAREFNTLVTGEECPWSILTEKDVREICEILESNNYTTLMELAVR